jgi:hypothetical protein
MKKFVQPDPLSGYRFTSYRIKGEGLWPFTETGYIYHKIDLSDLAEPYLSAVKRSLAEDLTPKETEDV